MRDETAIKNLIQACDSGRTELMALIIGLDEEVIQQRYPTVPGAIAKMEKAMQDGMDYINNKPARVPAATVGLGRRR